MTRLEHQAIRAGRLLLWALLAALAPAAVNAANYALLVGVSSYPSLDKRLHLYGPANDVPLMREVLVARGFPAQNIRVFADQVKGAHGEPTRAAILGELKALAGKAQKGDFVFLFFAGHGAQQPARNVGPANPEPDGLDEMFLPRDIGRWNDTTQVVQNAIIDDEFGEAIAAIRNRGAFVWAVFDTCHSGTITRGIEDDRVRYRDVRPADLGIPAAALAKADKAAAAVFPRTRGGPVAQAPMASLQSARVNPGAGGFVAFFAAQSMERAPEAPMPSDLSAGDPRKRSHGVFTYTLAETLAANPGMSYRQAAQQILQRYRATGVNQPTPMFEGEGASLDAPVFGTLPAPQVHQWPIERAGGALRIAAGALHQFGDGAVFAVVAKPGATDKEILGYLAAVKVDVMQSDLAPVERAGKGKLDPGRIPEGAYARLVSSNQVYTLRVALPPQAKSAGPHDAKARAVVERLSRENAEGLRVTWVPAQQGGDLRLAVLDGHLWLLPPTGQIVKEPGPYKTHSIDLAANDEAQVREKLVDALRRVGKVTNVLRLAARAGAGPVAQQLETRYFIERAPVRPAQGLTADQCQSVTRAKPVELKSNEVPNLRECDKLTMRIVNRNTVAVDVTVLLVDSEYGIDPLYPGRNDNNRITANGSTEAAIFVLANTVGRESLLLIASEARAGEETADFRFLSQASLPRTRSARPDGAEADSLRDVLSMIGFEPARTRGGGSVPQHTLTRTAMRLFTWTTVAR